MQRTLRYALLLLILAAPSVPAAPESRVLRIVWIDVEGGAATLVVTPAGESLLLDAGWPGERDAQRIARAARAEGVERIDHLLISHFHTDHWGGVADLARAIPIVRFYDRGLPDPSAPGVDKRLKPELRAAYLATTGGKSIVLKAGDRIPLAGVEVEIVTASGLVAGEPAGAPQTRPCTAEPEHRALPDDETENALSLGFLLTLGEFEFLALGDLTWNVEHKLVCPADRPAGAIGAIDVFQASHHGFDDSNNPALLAALQPTVAIVQNGPKKGGTAPVFGWLRATGSSADVFQLHRNITTGSADNAPPACVANDEEDCQGASIRLTLDPEGMSYTVEVPSKQTRRTYEVKASVKGR